MLMKAEDFIFGSQYYRAPTPDCESWSSDLAKMKEAGFNSVKFWVQWRWTHRAENEFFFDDIDSLMDTAYKNGLRVTLNVIFDVAPVWLYEKYPDSKMVTLDGETIEPRGVGHRQIGGFPGPCYNHNGAEKMRLLFLEKTVKRYANHPALDMWDVWNEPEQCGVYRNPSYNKLTCYCDVCKEKFKIAMKEKYVTIENLNSVWGRCYSYFDEIEVPREGATFVDFIDYREFMLDTLTREAAVRIETVKKLDKNHKVYLHVVPNTSHIFNSLTGVDDFELAKKCDIFASTNFASPIWSILTVSAAKDKPCYNVECHIGSGTTGMHQRLVEYKDLVKDLAPQIGMGLKGFMFWQYRPEILGIESPAWGVTKLDGSRASIYDASEKFVQKLSPFYEKIMNSSVKKPKIAIWKSRKNEIFNFCMKGNLAQYSSSYENYINAIYYNNYDCKIVDDAAVINNELDGIKLLILPLCYALTEEFAEKIADLLNSGISVLCEAHLGGYNLTKGRHSLKLPGCGLSEKLSIEEKHTTSSYHLDSSEYITTDDLQVATEDVKKAIAAYGLKGGKFYPIILENGEIISGAERFASLDGEELLCIGRLGEDVCIANKKVGKGNLYYCGTNLSEGAEMNQEGFVRFLSYIFKKEGITQNQCKNTPYGIHIDQIDSELLCVNNNTDHDFLLPLKTRGTGIFFEGKTDKDCNFKIPCKSAEIISLK